MFNFDPFERHATQELANTAIKKHYDYECIITCHRKSDWKVIEASHIFPIGQIRFKELRKYAVAAVPMCANSHIDFEWVKLNVDKRKPVDRLRYIYEHTDRWHRDEVFNHIGIFLELCARLKINYEIG